MTRTKFINRARFDYGRFERITFTRSRPYRKNDRAHVEQKNGAIVRALVGYDRYASRAAYAQLARVYPCCDSTRISFSPCNGSWRSRATALA